MKKSHTHQSKAQSAFSLVEHICGFSFPLRPTGRRDEARSRLGRAYCAPSSGFSLVELSIVLVILGLLTGGILAGQNLIRASELRSVSTEFNGYVSAVYTFRDKYFAIPGDMRNATDFWGAATCPAGTGTGTCNGDGNGQIANAPAVNQSGESFQFWQHLANAGLIAGNYSGLAGSGGTVHALIGTNVPRAKLGNAGWSVINYDSSGNTADYLVDFGNAFVFGSQNTAYETVSKVLTPEEAWNIDTKIDDGIPGSGSVFAVWRTECTLSSSPTDYNAGYALSSTATDCALRFKDAF